MIEEFEYNGKAMGTNYSIAIVCSNKDLANSLYAITSDNISNYEARFSRFLPTSELSLLNSKKEMIVSETFLKVILKAYQLFIETRGIFNPLVSISRLGYDKNFKDIENDKDVDDDSPYDIDFSSVVIDERKSYVKLNEGQNLDFGGLLKGYLAQILAEKIQSSSLDIKGVIVNLGGDIHTKGKDKNGEKFIFNIHNPVLKNGDVQVILYNQSLATSGTYKRSWFSFHKKVHHILDASGLKNGDSGLVSASVIGTDGATSEAYAKVFLSLGHRKALELLENKNLSFVVIKDDGEVIRNTI